MWQTDPPVNLDFQGLMGERSVTARPSREQLDLSESGANFDALMESLGRRRGKPVSADPNVKRAPKPGCASAISRSRVRSAVSSRRSGT